MRMQIFYRNTPNGLRVIDIFHKKGRRQNLRKQAGVKIFTNCPVKNQIFDYRALLEIQLSVDFLRVVQ